MIPVWICWADKEALDDTGLPKSPPNSDQPVVDQSPPEASFSLGKSPPLNGAAEAGGTGVGGLGEGTPKVPNFIFCFLTVSSLNIFSVMNSFMN